MEQSFRLMYHMNGGLSYSELEVMPVRERAWHFKRLVKQRKDENKAVEEAGQRK